MLANGTGVRYMYRPGRIILACCNHPARAC